MGARIPQDTQNLLAELLDRLLAEAAQRTPAKVPGTFTTKKVKGESYVYFQCSEPGGKVRQFYIGKKGPGTNGLIERFRRDRPDAGRERKDIERLCAQILAGGAWSMGPRSGRVLQSFSAAGMFEVGAVAVGTHAFGILGNILGVRWSGRNLRTQDLDLAAISMVAAAQDARLDAPEVLSQLEMGFLPVPALDRKRPSTSFKVRGEALRVDFLAPGRGERPVPLSRLNTYAQPLPYLDFLIAGPQRAAVADRGGFLVLVPDPARFALHKLIISGERAPAFQAKAAKDLAQSAELLRVLASDRPPDIDRACEAAAAKGWSAELRRGWKRMVETCGGEGLPDTPPLP